jgi:hypothetical protein
MKRREKNTMESTSHQTISIIGSRMKYLYLCGLLATLPMLAGPKIALVAQTVRIMELDEELPPMILVGFDKPAGSLPEVLMRRYFDLTPTHDPKREKDLLEAFG